MLFVKPLREQVYEHLRNLMHSGELSPGSSINITEISDQLGISKTPLRDALIQMEVEGFVEILPRRGFIVNQLTLEDVKNAYEIIGLLESGALISSFSKYKASHISKMNKLNNDMRKMIKKNNFDRYYNLNHDLHQMFLEYSDNTKLQKLIKPIKQSIYEFPRKAFFAEWELGNCDEHQQIIDLIKKGDPEGAAKVLRDVHWSYEVQKQKYDKRFN